jgi:hypothetical protein
MSPAPRGDATRLPPSCRRHGRRTFRLEAPGTRTHGKAPVGSQGAPRECVSPTDPLSPVLKSHDAVDGVGDMHSPDGLDRFATPCRESTSPAAYARRIASKASGFQRPELSRPQSVLTLSDRRILVSPRRRERAHGQRPMRRRGAIERDWAGGGYSSVSGDFHRWEARPPSASNGDKARDLPIGPRPRRPVSPERGRDRVRLSLNRAAHRTLADNERAERSASSKRYLSKNSGRCPALRVPFHQLSGIRVRTRDRARERPPQSLRDSSPGGGAPARCGGRSDPPPPGETARRVRRGLAALSFPRPPSISNRSPTPPEDPWPAS